MSKKQVHARCPYCKHEEIYGIQKAYNQVRVNSWNLEIVEGNTVLVPEYASTGVQTSMMTVEYKCSNCDKVFKTPVVVEKGFDITPTEELVFKWKGHRFQSSTVKTDEYKEFARDFKKAIKKELPHNFELVNFNVMHFCLSGFLYCDQTDAYVYFSISDVRYFQDDWINNVLIRTAEHEKDYSGGTNRYCNITQLVNKADMTIGAEYVS